MSNCMWCGSTDLWYDRSFTDWGDGEAQHDVCSSCFRPQLAMRELCALWDRAHDHNPSSIDHKPQSPHTATLTFDLTDLDGRIEFRDAIEGGRMRLALWGLDQKLRAFAKYGVKNTAYEEATPEEVFAGVRNLLHEYLDSEGIRLDEE